jgi:hypothetical protein
MEHGMQLVLTLAFVGEMGRTYTTSSRKRVPWGKLVVLGGALVACRYEDLFLVASAALLLMWRSRDGRGPALLALAGLPGVVFGFYSMAEGGHFLPNSVLLKGAIPHFDSVGAVVRALGGTAAQTLWEAPHLLALLLAALVTSAALQWGSKFDEFARVQIDLLHVFAMTCLLHAQFAKTGWFFRYESYLVALGLYLLIPALVALWPQRGRARVFPLVFLIGALGLLGARSVRAFQRTPFAAKNIHDQQWQIGTFLHEFFAGREVALNDIGAASLLGNVRLLDLYGLGTREVLDAVRMHTYGTQTIRELAAQRGTEIAILHPRLFADIVPKEWTLVGQWKIANNVICADATVSFYAVNPERTGELAKALRAFQLPLDVGWWVGSEAP